MKIIIMYDLPMDDEKYKKIYSKFHKNIIKRGYIMIQYSLYFKTINTITKYSYEKKHLMSIAPEKGHIRSLLITERQYYDMQIISGNKSLNEKINTNERYIKINEDIWQ